MVASGRLGDGLGAASCGHCESVRVAPANNCRFGVRSPGLAGLPPERDRRAGPQTPLANALADRGPENARLAETVATT
jgi:hypothetical protein